MQKKSALRKALSVSGVFMALLASGCAALAPLPPEKQVEQRANAFWQARATGNVADAYALTTPSYRKLRTEAQCKAQFGAGVSVTAAQVAKVTCADVKCDVSVKISINPAILRLDLASIATHADEVWLLEDGAWWRHQDL